MTNKKAVKLRLDRLVQTTLSVAQFGWVTRSARSEGISVAAFIRRLVILAKVAAAVERRKEAR